jgi:hypothetical protein
VFNEWIYCTGKRGFQKFEKGEEDSSIGRKGWGWNIPAAKLMTTSLTVFVCSTYSDLSKEREAVLDAIRRLQLQHDSMEFFGARSDQPIEACLMEVRRSNVLLVIVGHRYGTLVPELEVSFSEAEYREAYRLNKPCLVYLRGDDVPVLPKDMERDPDKLRALETWKVDLQKRHTVATFRHSNDLAVQVAADLARTIRDLEKGARTREQAQIDSPAHFLDEVAALVSKAIEQGAPEAALLSSIRRSVSTVVSEAQHVEATVFLSYAVADRNIVEQVAKGLKDAGIRESFDVDVWFDVDVLQPGGNWVQEIERGMDSADFIAYFISKSSVVGESWPQRELQIALSRQISGEGGPVILPILLEDAEVPPLLKSIQWLDMRDGDVEKGVGNLLRTIRRYARDGNDEKGVSKYLRI